MPSRARGRPTTPDSLGDYIEHFDRLDIRGTDAQTAAYSLLRDFRDIQEYDQILRRTDSNDLLSRVAVAFLVFRGNDIWGNRIYVTTEAGEDWKTERLEIIDKLTEGLVALFSHMRLMVYNHLPDGSGTSREVSESPINRYPSRTQRSWPMGGVTTRLRSSKRSANPEKEVTSFKSCKIVKSRSSLDTTETSEDFLYTSSDETLTKSIGILLKRTARIQELLETTLLVMQRGLPVEKSKQDAMKSHQDTMMGEEDATKSKQDPLTALMSRKPIGQRWRDAGGSSASQSMYSTPGASTGSSDVGSAIHARPPMSISNLVHQDFSAPAGPVAHDRPTLHTNYTPVNRKIFDQFDQMRDTM